MNPMNPFWQLIVGVLGLLGVTAGVGWVLYRWLKHSDEPGILLVRWLLTLVILAFLIFQVAPMVASGQAATAVFGVLAALVGGLGMALIWAPGIVEATGKKFAALYDGGDLPIEPKPCYSTAEARRKQGKYEEAAEAVRGELEKFPSDLPGWILLAEIQADDMHDLESAAATIEEAVSQPGHSPKNVAFALTRLADWRLKYAQDTEGARQDFERVVSLFPDSPEAHFAHQRLAHLAPREVLEQLRQRAPVHLPHSDERVGLRPDFAGLKPLVKDPGIKASELVQQLERYPFDNETREELALLYAEDYHRLDLATEQIEQLLAQPHAPDARKVHWLTLLADLHLKEAGDLEAAQAYIERIIQSYPGSAAAETASRRLATLGMEGKSKTESQVLQLGVYEQRMGLKMKGDSTTWGPPRPTP